PRHLNHQRREKRIRSQAWYRQAYNAGVRSTTTRHIRRWSPDLQAGILLTKEAVWLVHVQRHVLPEQVRKVGRGLPISLQAKEKRPGDWATEKPTSARHRQFRQEQPFCNLCKELRRTTGVLACSFAPSEE